MNKSEMFFISKLLLLSIFNLVRARENVTYSYTLWIGHHKDITAYSMQQTSPSGITFFDAMVQARDSGNIYYDFDSGSAPYFTTSITKISGIDSNWYVRKNLKPWDQRVTHCRDQGWVFYEVAEKPCLCKMPDDSEIVQVGVDELLVRDGHYYLWWFRRYDFWTLNYSDRTKAVITKRWNMKTRLFQIFTNKYLAKSQTKARVLIYGWNWELY